MSRNVVSCTSCTGHGNDFELIPTVQMESQHSVGWSTCHEFPRFFNHFGEIAAWNPKSLKTVAQKNCLFGKKTLTGKFSTMFSERIHADTELRLVCKFREIWLTENRQTRALFTGQKNKISNRSPAVASARIAPNICQGQLRTIYSEYPKFHPNPFTSGGVIAERVNIVETRHKVFPILGE